MSCEITETKLNEYDWTRLDQWTIDKNRLEVRQTMIIGVDGDH